MIACNYDARKWKGTGGRRGGREAPCSEKKPKTLESIRYQIRREYRYVAFKLCHVGGVIISYPCRLSGLCHSYPAFVISCETNAADTRHRGEITYSASNFLAVSPGEPKPSTQLIHTPSADGQPRSGASHSPRRPTTTTEGRGRVGTGGGRTAPTTRA